jgi:hypothetical protein
VFVHSDRRDWVGLADVLADSVAVDYTSLNGGEAVVIDRDDLVTAWRGTLEGFDATHHLLGSFLIDKITDGSAEIRFYGIATHVLRSAGDDPIWRAARHYDAVLSRSSARCQLTSLALHTDWVTAASKAVVFDLRLVVRGVEM